MPSPTPATIYLLSGDGAPALLPLKESPYDSEALLQELLAKYPNLLAGEQMDPEAPRRWLLITREASIPDGDSGPRWSLDHLFVDQDGIPTLIEVKRASDLRIRREVVGQMLDYAANAVLYWPVDRMQALFEKRCSDESIDAARALGDLLGESEASAFDTFWQRVKTNLQAGRVRLVFVADVIPTSLRTIVEFLNAQMDPAEVLAVEVRQFVGEGLRTLVPRVLGSSAASEKKKGARARRRSTSGPRRRCSTRCGPRVPPRRCALPSGLLAWARANGVRIWWGHGPKLGSFTLICDQASVQHFCLSVYGSGAIEIPFQHMVSRPAFAADADRLALLQKLNAIPGVAIPRDAIARRPSFPIDVLTDDTRFAQFTNVMREYVTRVRS